MSATQPHERLTTPEARALLRVVLVEPEIPGNTGSTGRLCAGTDTPLHLVGKLGFSLEDRYLKRAGLDYWPAVKLHQHDSWGALETAVPAGRRWMLTTRGTRPHWDAQFEAGDLLVFGGETRGLPEGVLGTVPTSQHLRIPILRTHIRSLNLANAVSIVLYEALRQLGFCEPQDS